MNQYIALERLESTFKSSPFVSNICVYATVDAKQPIAIIIPHEANLRQALKDKSIDVGDAQSFAALCQNDKVKDLVFKECNSVGKKNGFKGIETLQAVILTPDEWTPENGLVTAAQKVQRKKIAEVFDKEIKVLFSPQCALLFEIFLIVTFLYRRPIRTNRGLQELIVIPYPSHIF